MMNIIIVPFRLPFLGIYLMIKPKSSWGLLDHKKNKIVVPIINHWRGDQRFWVVLTMSSEIMVDASLSRSSLIISDVLNEAYVQVLLR